MAAPQHIPAGSIMPCSITAPGGSNLERFHLLSCGHIVALTSNSNWKCGLNCLHVTKNPFPFPGTTTDSDFIGCEVCLGLPISSYYLQTDHRIRQGLSLTRHVLSRYTTMEPKTIDTYLAKIAHPHGHPQLLHRLCCNHLVACNTPRNCASNCRQEPRCPHWSMDPCAQGDAIVCSECVYRAELVYSRYLSVRGGQARETVEQFGVLVPMGSASATAPRSGADNDSRDSVTSSNAMTARPFGLQGSSRFADLLIGDGFVMGDHDSVNLHHALRRQ